MGREHFPSSGPLARCIRAAYFPGHIDRARLELHGPNLRPSPTRERVVEDRERVSVRAGAVLVSKRIYVGSLPYSATEDQLEQLFGEYGKVSDAQVIMDRFTGQAKGFGFVEMENDDQADAAIAALNGSEFGGRSLVVNQAREREQRSPGGGGRR